MAIIIKNKELAKIIIGMEKKYPKYVSDLINLANRYSQGTRPKVVGQMTELIKECPYDTYEGWREWYLKKKPTAIADATKKIMEMLPNLENAMKEKIDANTVREWVEDLTLVKTFAGLHYQEAILKKLSSLMGKNYQPSTPKDESKGIDGFIGGTSVSIKPTTYKTKPELMEKIDAKIVFYKKVKGGIEVDASQLGL